MMRPPKEHLQLAREIADNMIALADQIDTGTASPIEEGCYSDYDLTDVLFHVRVAGCDIADAYYRDKPTNEQIEALEKALGPDAPKLDELYEAASKIIPFAAKQAWKTMVETEVMPDNGPYLSFHARLEEIDIEPQSEDVLGFLGGITREEFKRVDQAHALNAIHQDFLDVGDPMFLAIARQGIENRQSLSDVPFDVTAAFESVARRKLESLERDVATTVKRSGLTEQQVSDYMMMRLARREDAQNTSGPLSGGPTGLN